MPLGVGSQLSPDQLHELADVERVLPRLPAMASGGSGLPVQVIFRLRFALEIPVDAAGLEHHE